LAAAAAVAIQVKDEAAEAAAVILQNHGAGISPRLQLELLAREMLADWAVWAEPVEVAQVHLAPLAHHLATAMAAMVAMGFQVR
jgi:hypothetical protein